MKTIYLCGPINGCTDEECNDWRQWVKDNWAGPTLDPMRRDYRGKEAENTKDIVELDKIDVMNCDVVLANHPRPSTGTDMEIFYAWERGKLVVAVVPDGVACSPWLLYHSHRIFPTYKEALEWIREQ